MTLRSKQQLVWSRHLSQSHMLLMRATLVPQPPGPQFRSTPHIESTVTQNHANNGALSVPLDRVWSMDNLSNTHGTHVSQGTVLSQTS
jgi:hypothetical protein